MTEPLESIRDALTILRLAREVVIDEQLQRRVLRFAEAYLDANLPKLPKEPT